MPFPFHKQPSFLAESSAIYLPSYHEHPLFLQESQEVFRVLSDLDWSFSDDNTAFLTHDLHPYPAKFIPQIPGNLIARLSARGELVLDPFGGSGTTALEAVRLGRRALSIDANPVATLIGKVKTAKLDRQASNELQGMHGSLRAELQALPLDPVVLVNRFGDHAPKITNRRMWFPDTSFGELSLIRFRVGELESDIARDVAFLALSRTVLSASFQDSETRYKSVPREIPRGETLRRFLREFETIVNAVCRNEWVTRYGVNRFVTADIRNLSNNFATSNSVDLIVTSPPYGNATDYHLYHRFRLLWLGYDPIALGKVEIGSHLRHQREKTGFDNYMVDLTSAVKAMHRLLKPGRYAALVIGDSVYEGATYETVHLLAEQANDLGFDASCAIPRSIHKTKRSFTPGGRRATTEHILLLRKRLVPVRIILEPPPYRLWPYERELRVREIGATCPRNVREKEESGVAVMATPENAVHFRKLVFTHQVNYPGGYSDPTWQSIIENGMASNPAARKDPKYVTHGLHPYKGKFYPQLAKGLINLVHPREGAVVLDPFCGSGTTLLECYMNGLKAYGCDMHPLAALIARAKTTVLDVEPDILTEVVSSLLESMADAPSELPEKLMEFPSDCLEEIERWFAVPVARKINWLLHLIRKVSAGTLREFLEVILSSIIRDVSQQEPSDLRIRYRKVLLHDADVFGLFKKALHNQVERIEKFWQVRGYSPSRFFPAMVVEGDSREGDTFTHMGLAENSIDLILTSPPYATALPYIDTDRLSLLTILGIAGGERRPLEQGLIGSREISTTQRRALEEVLLGCRTLPLTVTDFLESLLTQVRATDGGFRKQNMPSLLLRFFLDMQKVLNNSFRVLKGGAEAMVVIGDNRMDLEGEETKIPTTDLLCQVAKGCGFETDASFDLSVTTENLVHIRNAITKNVVLRLRKPV